MDDTTPANPASVGAPEAEASQSVAGLPALSDPPPASPGTAGESARAEVLAARLAGFPGPAYKRAYLEALLRSGQGFLRSGSARSAAHCLDKVEAALQAAQASQPDQEAQASSGAARDARTPMDRMRGRWREERVLKASSVLDKYGRRLTSLERKAYREGLARWSKAQEGGHGDSAARRADIALLDLRRRLYGRILKSQKAVLVRRGGPLFVPVHAQFPGPIGPYNDRQNLEGVLNVLAEGDPAWVEEFLELYRGLAGLRDMIPSHRPA